ncbi:hypothetical protein [Nakamurella aerolata]|uniref:Uncharacterized protein n=1 Tax=Nakamurella aerolata TaxID=1656892 RepID=A0A849AAF8_9ACTN|nr:hypothetical protein [Nakamurella aerolata]NNG36576.1 hypothetical protein [Nakamurella aerolata]
MSEHIDVRPQAASSYAWRYANAAGQITDGPALAFDSQAAAEQWLAENAEQLLSEGTDAVSLSDGESVIYGPMPLSHRDSGRLPRPR